MATVSVQWLPEDDLLLKNAVEAGASLEALAKGAVQFSRRYTLQELRERWHALLYDPDISTQSAAHMFELEISGINPAPKLNRSENNFTGNKEGSRKRKSESIRRKYYAMRKKFRSELFSNNDLGFFDSNPHDFSGNGISDHLGLQEEDLDILRHAFPATISDIAVASGVCNVSPTGCPVSSQNIGIGDYGFDGNVSSSVKGGNNNLEANRSPLTLRKNSISENPHNSSVGFEGQQQFSSSNPVDFSSFQTVVFESNQSNLRHWRTMQDVSDPSLPVCMSMQDRAQLGEDMIPNDVEGKENSSTVYSGEFGDPDSLLNLLNEDDILLGDVDEKHAANKSCIDVDSVLQDSNNDDQGDKKAETELETVTASELGRVPAASANTVVFEVPTSSVLGEGQTNCQTEFDVPSKTASTSDLTRLSDGMICCTLNTEDPEIPCNDDIFLLIHPSTSFGSSSTQLNTTVGLHGLQESCAVHPLVGRASQTENHDSRPQALLPGFSNKTIRDSSKGGSSFAIPKQCSNSLSRKDFAGVDMKVGNNPVTITENIRSTEAGSAKSQLPESVADDSMSDQEESDVDDDVPYVSDIEAMILEMDLVPYDQDSRQVSSYQYDETKRTIIRLEQAARSRSQRDMTSQGALAILLGRHLRHYIKKPEVLLGRSTEDVDVDIDLRKEGRANKISRRQAIIKMEADGSFFIKNLGKNSVYVNGVAVDSGHLLNLSSSCLIEIKGMSFLFEINQSYVKEHLGDFQLKNKGKAGKSDWSAEDES